MATDESARVEGICERLETSGAAAFALMGAEKLECLALVSQSMAGSVPQIVADERQQCRIDLYEAEAGEYRRCVAAIRDCVEASTTILEELEGALADAGKVIDYAASILWVGRPSGIQDRPASIDKALRNFRKARSALQREGEG